MNKVAKFKEWMNENAPTLTVIYDNKYVGMAQDRFASLETRQQKTILLGILGVFTFGLLLYVFTSYLSLWSMYGKTDDSYEMITVLQQYQKKQREQSGTVADLQRGNGLSAPGSLKNHIEKQAQLAAISGRMVKVEEKPPAGGSGEDVKIKEASVSLEKVNLTQLKRFLNLVEFGDVKLSVSSIKISNDDKLRGYMDVQVGLVVYLFSSGTI